MARSLPPPKVFAIARRDLERREIIPRSTPVVLQQTVTAQFLDDANSHGPVAGLMVTPRIREQNGAEQICQPVRTDDQGKIVLKGLRNLPATITFRLPGSPQPDLPQEWTFKSPENAFLVLNQFQGQCSRRIAARPTYGLQVTTTSLNSVLASLVRGPIVGKAAGHSRAVRRPKPSSPHSQVTCDVSYHWDAPQPIILQRNYVDMAVQLPDRAQDARIYIPQAEEGIKVDRNGPQLSFQLPYDLFREGPIPIRLSRSAGPADFEGVLDNYPVPDPYAKTNELTAPPLRLVRLTDVEPPRGVDVLARVSDAEHVFRGLRSEEADARPDDDGSSWISDKRYGVAFRTRELPPAVGAKRGERIVEAIRLMRTGDGPIGGVRVGDDAAEVERLLGPAEPNDGQDLPYMQGGVRFLTQDGRVQAIELARPTALLREGTTAFTPRRPAKVFVDAFATLPGRTVQDKQSFEGYLRRTGVVQLVESRSDADYVLSAKLERLQEKKDWLLNLVPLEYECAGELSYSLYDNAEGRWVEQEQLLSASKHAKWMSDFGKLLLIMYGASRLQKDLETVVAIGLGAGGVAALQKSMAHAVQRTPRLVEQALYNQLSDKLYETVDFSGRVTAIDYERGEVTINLGTADGVRPSQGGQDGTMLDLLIAGQSLPTREDGLDANFYTLQTISATEHQATCVLTHVVRKLRGKGTREEVTATPDEEMARHILRPQTGVVSVHIRNRLVPIDDR